MLQWTYSNAQAYECIISIATEGSVVWWTFAADAHHAFDSVSKDYESIYLMQFWNIYQTMFAQMHIDCLN